MAVVESTSQSTFRKDMDEKRTKYARTKTATCIIVGMERKAGAGGENVTRGSAEPFPGQCVENTVKGSGENAEPRESRERERKKFLRGFYYRRAVLGREVADCAIY